ncbi:MAG: hypothetical protein QXS54_06735 [Candidatus Methanomethylicaceae archaeon]
MGKIVKDGDMYKVIVESEDIAKFDTVGQHVLAHNIKSALMEYFKTDEKKFSKLLKQFQQSGIVIDRIEFTVIPMGESHV